MQSYLQVERHKLPKDMLLESLDELLHVAEYCLEYRKSDKILWPEPHSAGVLGMPCAILLFAIVDTIGSYFRKNSNAPLDILVDGKQEKIGKTHKHFYILNSEYFGLSLSDAAIKEFYNKGRCRLMHNGVLGKELTLSYSNARSYLEVNNIEGKGRYAVHLIGFYEACRQAVNIFKENINDIVPYSPEGKDFK